MFIVNVWFVADDMLLFSGDISVTFGRVVSYDMIASNILILE